MITDGHSQNMLVERPREMRIQELAITDRLSNHTTNKTEVIQVVRIDMTVRIGLKGDVIVRCIVEQTVVRIEYLFRESTIPLSCKTPSVDAVLSVKGD